MKIDLKFFSDLVSELKKSGEVRVSGFGKFLVRQVKARKARNPKTGEIIDVPAKKKLIFRFAKKFKDFVL